MRYTANQATTQTQSRDNLSLALALQGKNYRAENLRRTSLHIASESAGDRLAKYLSPVRNSTV